jgi:hypothetical protein
MSFYVRAAPIVDRFEALLRANPHVLFVHAAGNDGGKLGDPVDPDNLTGEAFKLSRENNLAGRAIPNLLVVGNATADGGVGPLSNFGPTVALGARGTDVESANVGGGFLIDTGTSFAAPAAGNAAAKCAMLAPSLAADGLMRVLELTVRPAPAWHDKCRTGGLLDRERAYRLAAGVELVTMGAAPSEAIAKVPGTAEQKAKLARDLQAFFTGA